MAAPAPQRTRGSQGMTALVLQAKALHQAARSGQPLPLLKGRKLVLLCEDDQAADALLFRQAAGGLGAHVAHVRPSLSDLDTPLQVQHTAHMLGRLYDAVECQGLPASVVRQVVQGAGVPVFDSLAAQADEPARWMGLMEPPLASFDAAGPRPDLRCFVLQAALLQAIA
jgi:ornithine carbamoyltransferase